MLLGDFERAAELQHEALRWARELAFMGAIAFASNGIAMRHRFENNPAESFAPASEALGVYTEAHVPAGMAQSYAILGFAAADLGNRDDADRFHRDGLEQALVTGNPLILALALEGLAGVAVLDGDGERAARLLGKANALRSTTASDLVGLARSDVDRITEAATQLMRHRRLRRCVRRGRHDRGRHADGLNRAASAVGKWPFSGHADPA